MKIEPQIYVRGSVEAVEFYLKAFNGTLGFHAKNKDGTYAHADIMVGDSAILAICEMGEYDYIIHAEHRDYSCCEKSMPVMQFNIYDLGTQEAVITAYQILSEDAIRNENPNGPEPVPWSKYCFGLVDKYNIFWWISI